MSVVLAKQENFFREEYLPLIKSISKETAPVFGKMNVHQMVEHMADSLKIAVGIPKFERCLAPEDVQPKMKAFLRSEKAFRDNTKNALLPEDPLPVKFEQYDDAVNNLNSATQLFISTFEQNPSLTTMNPFFGELNKEENFQLLYKHAWHHLRQFGLDMPTFDAI